MEFQQNDLLTGEELYKVFTAWSPNAKAQIIASKLVKYMFIDKTDTMYFYKQNVSYKGERSSDSDAFYTIVTDYLAKSYDNIDRGTSDKLRAIFEKTSDFTKYIKSNLSNASVKSYEPQLKTYLKNDKIKLDDYTWKLHFNNGYINLQTGKFYKRVQGKHFITYYIPRDYIRSTTEQRNEILKHLIKIFPDEKDRECIFSLISRCLIGTPESDQDTLFLLGKGSSGKSFSLELTKSAIEGYLEECPSDMFENNNKNRDKQLNEFSKKAHVLIAWMNEFSDKKINSSDFKNFCDGKLKTTRLYTDGTTTIILKCKIIGTANVMPNFQVDTGTARRFLGFNPKSTFVDEIKDVDETNMKYLKDKYLLAKIKGGKNLLNAWVDILVDYCILNYNNKAPVLTDNFKETTTSVIATNDFLQDFIDSSLIITNNLDKDRIGKDEMKRIFKERYPEKHLTVHNLISDLKDRGLQYSATNRMDRMRGCYVGVKVRGSGDHNINDLDEIIINDKKPQVDKPKEPTKKVDKSKSSDTVKKEAAFILDLF